MQDVLGLITDNALSWVLTITVPALAVYGIRSLHALIQKTRFAQASRVDDVVFNILESEARTFTGVIDRAKTKAVSDKLKKKAAEQVLANLKVRMKGKGVDLAKSYGNKSLKTMLHTAVHAIKK